MSDVDRLRAAADRLEFFADVITSGTATDWVQFGSDFVNGQRATAALLRAVADEWNTCHCSPDYTERGMHGPYCGVEDVADTRAAALALADVILGGTDD